MPAAPFETRLPTGHRVPLVAHVPHASTYIPPRVRQDIVLTGPELRRELVRMTDWHADDLFSWVLEAGGAMFVNRMSRLVFDPERYADDAAEPMAPRGQGVVYTRTTDGGCLATISAEEREARIRDSYEPYHEALTSLVASTAERFGCALILDCHSFASVPLRSELDQHPLRPDICIGTDPTHTPPVLEEALMSAFSAEGLSVEVDRPFSGALVPLSLGGDCRIRSVMIEVRRGLYCDESTGRRHGGYEATRAAVRRAVTSALHAGLQESRACL